MRRRLRAPRPLTCRAAQPTRLPPRASRCQGAGQHCQRHWQSHWPIPLAGAAATTAELMAPRGRRRLQALLMRRAAPRHPGGVRPERAHLRAPMRCCTKGGRLAGGHSMNLCHIWPHICNVHAHSLNDGADANLPPPGSPLLPMEQSPFLATVQSHHTCTAAMHVPCTWPGG